MDERRLTQVLDMIVQAHRWPALGMVRQALLLAASFGNSRALDQPGTGKELSTQDRLNLAGRRMCQEALLLIHAESDQESPEK